MKYIVKKIECDEYLCPWTVSLNQLNLYVPITIYTHLNTCLVPSLRFALWDILLYSGCGQVHNANNLIQEG
jgi:hypothetical protein